MECLRWTALELGRRIRAGELTAVEAALRQIDVCEPVLNSFITIDPERVLEQARAVQRGIEEGRFGGALSGAPVAIKDNLCTRGQRTTCASRILGDFTPAYEAEAVARLRRAGAVILGKTNMDEFAMGSTTETSAFGATRNPWSLGRVPGGSSGGSCSAVAGGEAFYALGSDTGGSIRQPASFCGLVGLKPTYGRVSRYGLVAYASSMDQVGPIARSVADCAAVLEVIAGHDPRDSTSLARGDTDFTAVLGRDIKGMRIGIPRGYFGEGLDAEVGAAVRAAAQGLAACGAVVEEFELGLTAYAVPTYYTIASAEASSNLARFDGVKYGYRASGEGLHDMYKRTRSQGFGPEVKRRIMLGSFVLSSGYYDAYYLKALRTKARIKQAFDAAFVRYDLLLGPTAPTTAPALGESLGDPLRMYLGDIYTIGANLAGLPAISVPCGLDSGGLPIGLQLTADCFQEKKLLAAAYAYEQSRPFPLCPMLTAEAGAGGEAADAETRGQGTACERKYICPEQMRREG